MIGCFLLAGRECQVGGNFGDRLDQELEEKALISSVGPNYIDFLDLLLAHTIPDNLSKPM